MAIHVDILADLDAREVDREVDRLSNKLERDLTTAGERGGAGLERGITRTTPGIERALDSIQSKMGALRTEQESYNRSLGDGNAVSARAISTSGSLAAARRTEASAHREVTNAVDDTSRALGRAENAAKTTSDSLNSLGRTGVSSIRGGIYAAVGVLAPLLFDTARAAVTASQSLLLLPAGATAAAAGMGTLMLATQGFSQAIGDIRDPKKFATDLALLSPVAQQTALSIRALLPEFDSLQRATQDSFFNGFGQKLEQLTSVYLPSVQQLTTDIAGSFNTMISGIGDQLLTPQMQANVQQIMTNVSQTFQNLEPAATAFSQAFVTLTGAGSSFLPGLARDLSNVAIQFSNFLEQARQSGQLQEWISEGIQAVKELGTAIWNISAAIYQVFGSDGRQNISDFKDDMMGVTSVLNALGGDFGTFHDTAKSSLTFGADFREELDLMKGPAAELRDFFNNFPYYVQKASDAVVDFANKMLGYLKGPLDMFNNFMGNITRTLNMLPGQDRPANFGQVDVPQISKDQNVIAGGPRDNSTFQPWSTLPDNTPGGQFSNRNYSGPTDPTLNKPKTWVDPKTGVTFVPGPQGGWIPADQAKQPGPTGGPYAVPAPPPKDANGQPLSQKDIRDNIASGLDPSLWKVDPFATVPGLPPGGSLNPPPRGMPGVGTTGMTNPSLGQSFLGQPGVGGPMPRGGYNVVDQQAVFEAEHNVITQGHDLEEARKTRLALERDNTATQKEIDDAKWKEYEAGYALEKAQAELVAKQRGTTQQLTQGMNQLGVALDPDLGLSKGLSGFADNLTRMAGNMIFAPMEAQLQQISNASPFQGGFGLLGILGAQNMAQGLSPLLGRPYPSGTGYGTPGTSGTTGAPSYNTSGAPGAGYPGDAALLANVPKGIGQYDNATKDLSKGLVDCASGVEDLVNIMDGKSTVGGSLWTGNASSVLPGMGFQPGMGGPGDFRIGYNSHHMQATLPGGTNVNYGSTPAIQAGGLDGGQGAYDPSFTDHWYRPAGGGAGPGGTPGGMSTAGMGGATPVFVTNMPGGGMGGPGGFSTGTPAAAPGGGAPGGGSGFNWDAIAGAEASGNWANKSNPKYQGGLQFDPSTWARVKPAGAPDNAADASKEQQIAGAEALIRSGADPSTQWPATFKAHPEWFGRGGTAGAPSGGAPGGDIFSPANTNPGLNNPPPPLGNPADLFTGGGGQGPIFRKPAPDPGGIASASGTASGDLHEGKSYVPPGAEFGPAFVDPTQPYGPMSPAPGTIGGIPVPPSVAAAAPGGIGNSAMLTPGMGIGSGSGWTTPAPTPTAAPGGAPGAADPNAAPTHYGGVTPGVAMGGTGGVGIQSGGTLDTAIGAAAAGLDIMAPGAGQAAQIGIKEANRAIQYVGSLAGIGVSGLMETFLPTGGSELANSGWIPRIVGGLAGAKPALPNIAGGKSGGQAPPPLTPEQATAHMGTGAPPGPQITNNVDYTSVGQTEDRNGADLTHHLTKGYGG